jgi:surfactin synthase thioesterase subunit
MHGTFVAGILIGQAFIEEYLRREQIAEWAFLKNATLFFTGHSLGRGLAHEFAYSLPRTYVQS